jgi:hypothetical protein
MGVARHGATIDRLKEIDQSNYNFHWWRLYAPQRTPKIEEKRLREIMLRTGGYYGKPSRNRASFNHNKKPVA